GLGGVACLSSRAHPSAACASTRRATRQPASVPRETARGTLLGAPQSVCYEEFAPVGRGQRATCHCVSACPPKMPRGDALSQCGKQVRLAGLLGCSVEAFNVCNRRQASRPVQHRQFEASGDAIVLLSLQVAPSLLRNALHIWELTPAQL